MLVIDCPYCGPRPELEFSYGGQAHIARPADPASVEGKSKIPNREATTVAISLQKPETCSGSW